MKDLQRLPSRTHRGQTSRPGIPVLVSVFRLAAIASSLGAALGVAGCDRGGAKTETKLGAIALEETTAGNRQLADEFLAQVARRRQIAANERAIAAKYAAADVVLRKDRGPTRNAQLKTDAERLAAAVDRRADEAQGAADFHLELARKLEGAVDAQVRR